MNINGSCTGSSGAQYLFFAAVSINSQNTEKNRSNITVTVKLRRNDGFAASAYNLNESSNSVQLTVGGVRRVSKNLKIDTRNGATVTLCTWTGDVSHAADGTLNLAVSASFLMSGTSLTGGSLSGSVTVPDIARASSAALGASAVSPGGSLNIAINCANNSFTHRLTFKIGSHTESVTVSAGVGTYTFNVPQSWASYVTGSRKGSVALTLSTYSGSALLGSKQYSFTLSIPDSAQYRPTFDITLTRLTGTALADTGEYVKGKSLVRVAVTGVSCKYGAVQKAVYASVCSVKKALPAEFSLTSSGNVTVSATLKDSRGLQSTVTKTITVRDYSEPTVSIASVTRCNASGEPDMNGSYLSVDYSADVSPVNGHNSGAVKVSLRAPGDESFGAGQMAFSSPVIIGGSIQSSSSYTVKMSVSDTVSGEGGSIFFKVPSAQIAFNLKRGGRGAAFGCFAETENELTVGYNLRVNGRLFSYDLSDEFSENDSYISGSDVTLNYIKCIGTVLLSGRLTVGSEIAAGQTVYIGSIGEHFPQRANALGVFVNGNSQESSAHIRSDGLIGFRSAGRVEAGKIIYINGFWFNNAEVQEG